MVNPVMTRSGLNFERSAILSWLEKTGSCPLTRKPLKPSNLFPNKNLENTISFWRKKHGIAVDLQPREFNVVGYFLVSNNEADEIIDSRPSLHSSGFSTNNSRKSCFSSRPAISSSVLFRV
jgi:hypothetical protein